MSRQSLPPSDPALAALANTPTDQPLALLHSGRAHRRWAMRSMLARPVAWYVYSTDGVSRWAVARADSQQGEPADPPIPFTHNPWADLRALLNCPDLPGKWIGYFSYDLAHLLEPGKLPRTNPATAWPLIELAWCPQVREFPPPTEASAQAGSWERSDLGPDQSSLTPDFTRSQYESAVQQVIDYIAAGDVFQVNLAQRFCADYTGSPRDLFARLAAISPAWYGAYLEMSDVGCAMSGAVPNQAEAERSAASGPDRAILSTSPELFLQLDNRHVITRPIKGTQSATRNPQSEIEALRHSAKDIAELNMIVDLMRNDLGKVCAYGSVKVDAAREIETHPTVHHGVATISGDLHESRDIVDLLKATLPGGSITGAPKVRAMQIIDQLEPVSRGPYCGSIGWITKDACQLNIAIRTMMLQKREAGSREQSDLGSPPEKRAQAGSWERSDLGPDASEIHAPTYRASFSVGGGIVADSHPAAEYDETLTKARAMLAALGASHA